MSCSIVGLPTVASEPAVLRGLIPVRYAAATQWSEPVVPSGGSADFDQSPLMTTVWSFTFSSDSRMKGSFESGPSAPGSQYPGAMPCGKKTPPNRGLGVAASAAASTDEAGSMASRSGSVSVQPALFKNVRRGMGRFGMNIELLRSLASVSRRVVDGVGRRRIGNLRVHLKRLALHDRDVEGRKEIPGAERRRGGG